MIDSANLLTCPGSMPAATVAERSLVREWRDRLNEEVVTQPLLIVVAMRVAFGLDRDGPNELGDLLRERTGAEVEKAVSGLAWSTSVRAPWREGSPTRDHLFAVTEVQATVNRADSGNAVKPPAPGTCRIGGRTRWSESGPWCCTMRRNHGTRDWTQASRSRI